MHVLSRVITRRNRSCSEYPGQRNMVPSTPSVHRNWSFELIVDCTRIVDTVIVSQIKSD